MNSLRIGHLVWKEYRQQRPLWLAVAGLSFGSQLVVVLAAAGTGEKTPLDSLFLIGLGMPALYALGCGALLFAGENEAGTIGLLRSIPVSSRDLLIAKLGFAVASILLLIPILWLGTVAITRGALPDPASHARMWLICGVAWIEVLAWSVLFSLLARHVLAATLLAGCAMVLAAICWASITGGHYLDAGPSYLHSVPAHLATTLTVALAAIYAGRRWLDELPAAARKPWTTAAVEPAATDHRRRVQRSTLAVCQRLVWQEWRQAVAQQSLLVAAAITVLLFAMYSHGRPWETGEYLVFLSLLGAIAGTCVFAGDQRQAGFRYFRERGVQPRMVWLARQLTWSGWLVVTTISAIGASILLVGGSSDWLWWVVGQSLIFYCIGQACSLFIRSSVLAIVATAGGCSVAALWHVVVLQFGIPGWAVWPIAPVLLLATWLRMPDWVAECGSRRARWQAIGSLAVPAALLLVATGTFRATEIPRIPLPYDRADIERDPMAAERYTADQYREASQRFKLAASAEGAAGENLRAEALQQFMAATQRDRCRFANHESFFRGDEMDLQALPRQVADLAAAFEQNGQLDEALDIYWALLRLAEHLYAQPSVVRVLQAFEVERLVLERLPRWAARPGQSSRRVLDALARLETQLNRGNPDWELALGGDYCLFRRLIELEPATVARVLGPEAQKLRYVAWLGGSEQARMLRLLDQMAASDIEYTNAQWRILQSGGAADHLRSRPNGSRIRKWQASTPPIGRFGPTWPMISSFDLAEYQVRRRVARIQLALVAWQIEHQELPATLAELVNHGLETVPRDPFSGHRFGYAPGGGYVLDQATKVFESGTPCLWSPGRNLGFAEIGPDVEPLDYRHFYHFSRPLTSEYDLWQYGVRYPIPLLE